MPLTTTSSHPSVVKQDTPNFRDSQTIGSIIALPILGYVINTFRFGLQREIGVDAAVVSLDLGFYAI